MKEKKDEELAQILVDQFLCLAESKKYGLSSYETLLLLYLANRLGKNKECWPKKPTISSYTGLPIRTLERAIQSLKAKNLITVIRKGKLNYYSFTSLISACQVDDQKKDIRLPGGQEGSSPAYQADMNLVHPPTRRPTYNNSIQANNSLEPNNSLMFTDVNASKVFEQFWEAYPRKQNKKKAQKAWKNKKLDDQIDLIIEDIAKRKLDDQQWKSKQFIPLATTYLNGERWNDEIIKQEEKKQNNSTQGKPEIKSTVPDWVPVPREPEKTEEEKKRSDDIRIENMKVAWKSLGARR